MKKVVKIIFGISFIFYLLALVMLLFVGVMFVGVRVHIWTDLSLIEYIRTSSNFVPFKTISTYIMAMFDGSLNLGIPIKNLIGNLIMFLPMGIYLPYYIKKINKVGRFTFSMIILLFVIEVTQLVTRRGSFDIDDFILNMVGALIGFGIWKTKIVQRLFK
ncbi:VanZ family protein [Caldifermentibacillus hisashii]|uniref:VanZ family protein n=1 Tax=Caldifermentibacillus hisashii TaxID=996558 RepID=UPI000BA40D47|nr:VanZ family protein [Caldifermentibacillus hisashii]PAC32741.1 VanZ family protein [Caldifermentibacillus hisashii]